MRTHIVIPDGLVSEIDRLVGKRGRSAFITKAVQQRVRRERLREALKESAGVIKAEDHPEWATSRQVAAWVRKMRRQSERRQKRLYG